MDKPLVEIVWHDAADMDKTWVHDSEIEGFTNEPIEFVSYGILLKKTKAYITIAGDFSTEENDEDITWGRVTKIPRGMVKSLKEL